MPVLVTAFGPFGGRERNASMLALMELRKMMPEIRTRILPVDAVLAPSRLRQALREIRPDALIMLGEAAGSDAIRLEGTAWNEKDFRIPDIAGRMPTGVPIRPGAPASMPSTLPLREIHQCLADAGQPVTHSQDPGRYLCNQLFFSAMDFLKTNALRIPAGFIHLPLEGELPSTKAAEAIAEAIRRSDAR
ncbi:pyroglutamyl-peptidase I [Akkermansiaceae bacterium]|nr:pyroglutamyl-peptidase I [Akkermansiaceae bacterium]